MTGPDDLIGFLEARISDDEEQAGPPATEDERYAALLSADFDDAAWITINDHIRADCAAKRLVIVWARQAWGEGPSHVLRLLAHAYAKHPDYNPDWRL